VGPEKGQEVATRLKKKKKETGRREVGLEQDLWGFSGQRKRGEKPPTPGVEKTKFPAGKSKFGKKSSLVTKKKAKRK